MKIREIKELNQEMKLPVIAKEHLPFGEKRLYALLKEIGCKPPEKQGQREWDWEAVSEEDLDKDVTEFGRTTAKVRTKASNSKSNSTKTRAEVIKRDNGKENDMKAEIEALIKGTSKEESNRIYKGIYFDKDIANFLDNVQHGNKSEIVNKIMRQYLNENDLW